MSISRLRTHGLSAGHPGLRWLVVLFIAVAVALPMAFVVTTAYGHGSVGTRIHRAEVRVALDPTDPRPHLQLAEILLDSGQLSRAASEFDVAESLSPELPDLFLGRSILLLRMGDPGAALEQAEQLLVLDSLSAAGYRQRGRVHLELGGEREAVRDLETALRLVSAPTPDQFLEVAALLPPHEALAILADARRACGVSIPVELAAVEHERSLSQWDRALQRLEGLERFYSRQEPLLELRAEVLLQSGSRERAHQVLTRLIELLRQREAAGRSTASDRESEARALILLEHCSETPIPPNDSRTR